MASNVLLISLLLLGTALAVPLQESSQCNRQCVHSDSAKFAYEVGKTYSYAYQSESVIKIKTLEESQAQLRWTAIVDIHFTSPCALTLEIRNPKIDGASNPDFEKELTKHPLKAVMSDGTFYEVCADAEDSTNAVNIKKGILSSLQNTLPSLSTIHNNIKIEETDVVGVCKTTYKIEGASEKFIVKKLKDHRLCSKRYGSPSESPMSALPLKAPFPLKASNSLCVQGIEKGVVTSVACEDFNEVSPMIGFKKSLLANQKSTLELSSVSRMPRISSLVSPRITTLLFDYTTTPKSSSAIQDIETELRKMCSVFGQSGEMKYIAVYFSSLVSSMDEAPERSLPDFLHKIRRGEYCHNSKKLESLYLDAILVTENSGVVSVMVEEILSGRYTSLYSLRMQTIVRPSTYAIESLVPLYERDDTPIMATLAAGSLIQHYCRFRDQCSSRTAIMIIADLISTKLGRTCRNSQVNLAPRDLSLSLLNSVGNMKANMTTELRSAVLACFEEPNAAQNVRLAAVAALQDAPCDREVTTAMLTFAMGSEFDEELRIFAYKAGVLCANRAQLSDLIDSIKETTDVQVRTFILSHLTNLQWSTNPYKLHMRQLLAPFNIPQDYPKNYSISHNYDIYKFTESKYFGVDLDSDIVYANDRNIPRQMRTNVTLALFKEIFNVAEFGARFENMPAIIESIVGAGGSLEGTYIGKLIEAFLKQTQSGESGRIRRDEGQLDLFLKLFGQQIMFKSLSSKNAQQYDILYQIAEEIVKIYREILSNKHIENLKAYKYRIEIDIPTIQGIPLRLKQDITGVLGLNAVQGIQGYEYSIELKPTLSAFAHFSAGYSFGPYVGVKHDTTVYSASDSKLHLKLDLPNTLSLKVEFPSDTIELLTFESKGYLAKQLPGESEQTIEHSQSSDPRIQSNSCSELYSSLQMCLEYNIPDPWRADNYPFVGISSGKWMIKKHDQTMKSFEFSFATKEGSHGYIIRLDVPGTQNPKKMDIEIEYEWGSTQQSVMVLAEVMQRSYGFQVIHKNEQNQQQVREIEVFTNLRRGQSTAEKVFSWKMANPEAGMMELKLKTSGTLARVLEVDIDVKAGWENYESSAPLHELLKSIRLDKVEIVVGAFGYKSENYLRKMPQTPGRYDTQLKLARGQSTVMMLKAVSLLEIEQQGCALTNEISIQQGENQWESKVNFALSPEKRLLSFELTNERRQRLVKLIASDIEGRSSNGVRKTLLSLSAPNYGISWRLASQVEKKGDQYEIAVSAMSNNQGLLSINGPVSGSWTEGRLQQKAQLGIKFGPSGDTFYLITAADMSYEKNYVNLIIHDERTLLVSYLHDLVLSESTALTTKLELPGYVKADFIWKWTASSIYTDVDVHLEVISPRDLKAYMNIDMSSSSRGQVAAKLFWDKARDPGKHVAITGHYNLEGGTLLSVHGDVDVEEEKYHYSISTYVKRPMSLSDFEKQLKIKIMKDATEIFGLEASQIFKYTRDQLDSTIEFNLLTPYGNTYSFEKDLHIIVTPDLVKLEKDFKIYATTFGEISMHSHGEVKMGQEIYFSSNGEYKITRANEHEPAVIVTFHAKCVLSLDDLQMQSAEIEYDFEESQKNSKIEFQVSGNAHAKEIKLMLKKNYQELLQAEIKQLDSDTTMVHLRIPPVFVEVSGTFAENSKQLSIYPDWRHKESFFGVSYTKININGGKRTELKMEYPQNRQQNKLSAHMDLGNQEITAVIEADILPGRQQPIKMELKGQRIYEGLYSLEGSFVSNGYKRGPNVLFDISTIASNKHVIMSYKSTQHGSPSILLSAKYTTQSEENGVVDILIETPWSKVELGGVLSGESTYGCAGYKLHSTTKARSGQIYFTEVQVCSPSFIKIVTGAKEGSRKYVAKVGLQSYTHAEVSFMEDRLVPSTGLWSYVSGSQQEESEVPIVALSAKLLTPMNLELRAQLEQSEVGQFMLLLAETSSSVTEGFMEILKEIKDKVYGDFRQQLPELCAALDQVQDELQHLMLSIKECDVVVKLYNQCSQYIEMGSNFFKRLFDELKKFFESLRNLLCNFFDTMMDAINKYISEFKKIIQAIIDAFKKWLEPAQEMFEQMSRGEYESVLHTIGRTSLGQEIIGWLEYARTSDPEKVAYLKEVLVDFLEQLHADLLQSGRLLMQDKSVQYTKSLLRRYIDMIAREEYLLLSQSALLDVTGILVNSTEILVNLPLSRPVSSVLVAPRYISFRNFAERRSSLQLRESHSFSGKQHSMVTYYEQEFDLPHANCEYVLARDGNTILTFKGLPLTIASSITMRHGQDVITLIPLSNKAYVNGAYVTKFGSYQIGKMSLEFRPTISVLISPDMKLTTNEDSAVFMATTKNIAVGIGFEKFSKNHPPPQEVLRVFGRQLFGGACH